MAIEYHEAGTQRGYRVVMTACPLCGEPFEPADSRAWHFYREHGPEDIGL